MAEVNALEHCTLSSNYTKECLGHICTMLTCKCNSISISLKTTLLSINVSFFTI